MKSVDGNPLRIGGVEFSGGVGSHANSEFMIDLRGTATRFEAIVGVDDEVKTNGSVNFQVWVDGKLAAESGVMRGGQPGKTISVSLVKARTMTLIVEDGDDDINYDHADWAEAKIFLAENAKAAPIAVTFPVGKTVAIARIVPGKPEIHGPRVVGCSINVPFIFRVPATSSEALTFDAKGLLSGLILDAHTGIITGSVRTEGEFTVKVAAFNRKGTSTRNLKIVCGENKLALTPPMGWNSWNVWATTVDAEKVKAAADALVESGLANYGYQYVNIDDGWAGAREVSGVLKTNEKFPDMREVANYVHSKGLKLGIYSSPGPKTCAGYEGSYRYELQDARLYAEWGIDYLKYDWCSYGSIAKDNSLPELKRPYITMRDALKQCGRDIVYSLCQYGMGEVWNWGKEVGGNLWRTTGDITDTWGSMSGIAFAHFDRGDKVGPGAWNDPDMLVVGLLGWGANPRPTRLTKNEQITHITMWSLLAAPLILGCDLTKLDRFTLDLLTNHDVIEVNQDPLGKPAKRVFKDGKLEVWSRPLWDGTLAVGLINRGRFAANVSARWSDLGIRGKQPVRNLWLRKDIGLFTDSFTAEVPSHASILLKIGRPKYRGRGEPPPFRLSQSAYQWILKDFISNPLSDNGTLPSVSWAGPRSSSRKFTTRTFLAGIPMLIVASDLLPVP
jgi:alpha-galactosidase